MKWRTRTFKYPLARRTHEPQEQSARRRCSTRVLPDESPGRHESSPLAARKTSLGSNESPRRPRQSRRSRGISHPDRKESAVRVSETPLANSKTTAPARRMAPSLEQTSRRRDEIRDRRMGTRPHGARIAPRKSQTSGAKRSRWAHDDICAPHLLIGGSERRLSRLAKR